MTAIATALRLPRSRAVARSSAALPPLGGGLLAARTVFVAVLAVAAMLMLDLIVLGPLQHRTAQQRLFERFRAELAKGTAPLGATDEAGRLLQIGTPVAYLEIPELGLRQVVVEGTTSGALTKGPGHRRDSPLPGQAGVSVVLGRAGAYGAPFGRLDALDPGDEITVTTGTGLSRFEVIGVRREGDELPPALKAGSGRLVLTTAEGPRFLPQGLLRVDADLVGTAQPATARPVSGANLPAAEESMGADSSRLWSLAFWLQALTVVVLGAVWTWHRRGRAHAWIVFVPPVLLVSLGVADNAVLLLPNVL